MSFAKIHDLRWTGTVADEAMLGMEQEFSVIDYITTPNQPSRMNSAKCRAIFCLNKSGGTLAEGAFVEPSDTTSYGFPYAVDVVAGADEYGVGFVSPFIPGTTVADGEGFWLITAGLTKMRYSGSGAVLVGSYLESAASGAVTLQDDGVRVGVAHEAINGSAAGTLFWAYIFQTGLA